jgi:hypothetical protein
VIARPSILLIMAATIAAIVCGCGGSGGDATTAKFEGPPKPQLVKQVNAVCTRTTGEAAQGIEAYETEYAAKNEKDSGTLQARAIAAAYVPKLAQEIEEIRAVAAKRGEEGSVVPYLEALESAAGEAGEGEPSSLPELIGQFKAADKLATKYGLKTCIVF